MKKIAKAVYETLTHTIGRITKKYYYEDYIRVYPDALKFDRIGRKIKASKDDINNYKNHCKFYYFASQFVKNKKVADVGCGSGYGCEIIKNEGANYVHGFDVSKASIAFASSHFSNVANFSIASITDLNMVNDNSFMLLLALKLWSI